jgi:hypothetical protein
VNGILVAQMDDPKPTAWWPIAWKLARLVSSRRTLNTSRNERSADRLEHAMRIVSSHPHPRCKRRDYNYYCRSGDHSLYSIRNGQLP